MPKPSVPPDERADLHERVALLIDAVGGTGKAARIAGVNRDTVNNWRKPGAWLPLQRMAALVQAAGKSLDWLATGGEAATPRAGREPPTIPAGQVAKPVCSELRSEVLVLAIGRLEDWLRERGIDLPAHKKAEAIALIYEIAVDDAGGDEARERRIERVLRLVA